MTPRLLPDNSGRSHESIRMDSRDPPQQSRELFQQSQRSGVSEKAFEFDEFLFILLPMGKKHIWAPWRAEYILGEREEGCIFCNRFRQKADKRNLIIYRGQRVFIILNKFPYNSGHCMVVPNRHISSLDDLTKAESAEFMDTVRLAVRAARMAFNPDSFNVGMNMGHGSGAGIPEHIHMHVVPRWQEDTNFMPVIGDTEVVSFPLDLIYRRLRKGIEALCPGGKSRRKRS